MSRDAVDPDLSELEQEFELEMDDFEVDEGARSEGELADELEAELQDAGEHEEDLAGEWETGDAESGDYADRFFELSQRGYESADDAEAEIGELVGEIGQDAFIGGLRKFVRKKGRGWLKRLGGKFVGLPAFQALKALSGPAQKLLKSKLGTLAQTALASAIPGGAAVLPALKALGFDPTGSPEANKEAWENYVDVAREAYDHLAENLHETADDPVAASELASKAFRTAVRRGPAGMGAGRRRRRHRGGFAPGTGGRAVRAIVVERPRYWIIKVPKP